LTPDEATAIVQAIPAAAELVPELKLGDLIWVWDPEEAPDVETEAPDVETAFDDDDVPF
jgi:hypothetical protein